MYTRYRVTEETSKNLNTFLIPIVTFDSSSFDHRFDACNCRINACANVDTTLAQSSIWRLCDRSINSCMIIDSTLLNRRIDACAAVDSILNRRFGARFQTLMCMSFRTWIQFIFSYFTSYLDTLYYRDKFQKLKNYWWRLPILTEQKQTWTKQQQNVHCMLFKKLKFYFTATDLETFNTVLILTRYHLLTWTRTFEKKRKTLAYQLFMNKYPEKNLKTLDGAFISLKTIS